MRSLGLRMEKAVPIKIAIICNLLFGTICFWLVRGGENISFLSCWSSDLEAFLSYYYSRNIVRRTNYCMEKMTGWVKMLWGSTFCRVCVTIQYFFFSPSYLYNFGFAFRLLWIHNLSMNSYFIFPGICEVLYFGFWSYSSVFMWSF